MLKIEPTLPQRFPFIQHPHLMDFDKHREALHGEAQQIISYVNINPEDYVAPETAATLCREANEELVQAVHDNPDIFVAGVGMIPMNNLDAAVHIIEDIAQSDTLVGIQVFTRALGKSIADPDFRVILKHVRV